MFDYRYHALSLAAVLFALMLGVLLGVAIGDSNLVSSAKNGIVAQPQLGSQRLAPAGRPAPGTADATRKRSPTACTRSRCTNCSPAARSGSCSSATPPTRSTRSCAPPSRRRAATSRPSSPCTSRSTSQGLEHEAAGTHYAALGSSTELIERFGDLIGRQLVSGGPARRPRAHQPRARQPAQRLRRAARAPGRARRRARRADRA